MPAHPPESRRPTEFLLADIVDISADAIICIDEEQRITLFNEGAVQIFGWTADEVMGKPLDILLPERVREVHRRHVVGFSEAPDRARRMGQRQEISGLRKNGEEFAAEAAISKVRRGESVVFSVLLRDITEQVELHKRLQRAVKARDDTVGVVAHDLRNPVNAVKMLSAALLNRPDTGDLPADAVEQMRLIRDAALQMDRLIQDLLDLTRVETGRLRVDPHPVATVALIDGALRTLKPLIEEAGLTLRMNVPPLAQPVQADSERIGQVLSNLIGNAIKFTPQGGTISIAAIESGDALRVSVSDTGTGIAREQLANLFDRYWETTPSSVRSRGAGLGLPIARGIIVAHKGRIWAESEPGTGTTFHFTLPFALPAA